MFLVHAPEWGRGLRPLFSNLFGSVLREEVKPYPDE